MTSLAALATLFLFLDLVVSQVDWPPCSTDTMTWNFNSLGQNSCRVAAFLLSTCSQGIFTVPALPFGSEYGGPSGHDGGNNDWCICNTVVYSLLSACDACQGELWIPYSDWGFNCTTFVPPSTFPNVIPYGTSVPHWALLDVTDMNAAMAAGDSPEVGPGTLIGTTTPTITLSPTVFPTFPTTTPTTPSPTSSHSPVPVASSPSSTSPAASLSRKSSSHTAVIVGGGVAAVVIIVVVVLAIFYLRRRRNDDTKPPYAPFSVPSLPAAPSVPVTTECASPPPQSASPPLSGARNVGSEAQTIASSVMQDSAPMGVYNPANDAPTWPEVQDPDAPHRSVQALFGQSQGGGNNLAYMHVSRPEDFSSQSSA